MSMASRTAYSTWTPQKPTLFSGHYLRNRSTLDIGVLGYIGIVQHKEHSPEVLSILPGTPCIYIWIRTLILRTVTVLFFKTVSEPIQQNTEVHFTVSFDEMRWTSTPTNCHPFLFFICPTSFLKASAVCVLWLFCIQLSVLKVSED